jgi:hypothetical protein
LLFTIAPAFGQSWARATYSTNEKMIEIADLQGLQSCSVTNLSGKPKKIKIRDDSALITIKQANDERIDLLIPLTAVKPEDRRPLFGHLVTKKNNLEIAGYRCSEDSPASAFSVRRVYSPPRRSTRRPSPALRSSTRSTSPRW